MSRTTTTIKFKLKSNVPNNNNNEIHNLQVHKLSSVRIITKTYSKADMYCKEEMES